MKNINFKTVSIIVLTAVVLGFLYNYYSEEKGIKIIPEEPVYVDDSKLDGDLDDNDITEQVNLTPDESKKETEENPTKDTVKINPVKAKKDTLISDKKTTEKEKKVEEEKNSDKTPTEEVVQNNDASDEEFGIVSYKQIKERINNDNFLIIDARGPQDYQKEHIGNAINIFPHLEDKDEYFKKIYTLPRDKKFIIYCTGGSCDLSHELANDLRTAGFENIFIYTGGWDEWEEKSK